MKTTLFSLVAKTASLLPQSVKSTLYRLGPISRLIRKSLNRLVPSGSRPVKLAGGALVGMTMNLDLQIEKDYWLGTYEVDLQNVLQEMVQPGWIAYDIGANIGYITLLLAKLVGRGGQVIAFEALPDNAARLRENIELNGLASTVRVVQSAVSNTSGLVNFLVGPSGAMGKVEGSAGRQDLHQQPIEVPAVKLDDFVPQDGIPLPQVVKVDIEGGEVLALPGMSALISEARPFIFLELHGPEAARVSLEHLQGAGYTICRMKPGLPQVSSPEQLDWKSYLLGVP